MHLFQSINCLLLVYFPTLHIQIGKVSASNELLISNDQKLLLSFNSSHNLTRDIPTDDEVVEEVKDLDPNTVYYLYISSIPDWAQFIVVQTHVYLHNVTLGYNLEKVANKYVTGQNIGLVQYLPANSIAKFFVENDNPFIVTILIAAVAYGKSAPIPGGCNMEFAVETAPWLQLNVTGPTVVVGSQAARSPQVSGLPGTCGPSLYYEAYHLFLPEQNFMKSTYFEYIHKMMTVSRIRQNGRKVPSYVGEEMRHVFSAYHGTGSVYAVVAYANVTQYSAYVPALTYTCSPARYTDTCQVLTSTFSRSLCALVLFIGLFVCLFGHSFFLTELFLFGTLIGSIVFYVLVVPYGFTDSTNVLLATVGGVTSGNVLLILWWVIGSPLVSLLSAALVLGYFVASVIFYKGLADTVYMTSDTNYWLTLVVIMLVTAVILVPRANRANILACCVVGSYAAIVPIDHYIGGNVKYIFINSIRRVTVPGFNLAIIDPPFQIKDIILESLWFVLALVGYVMQSKRFGDKPAFPPSSTNSWRVPPSLPVIPEERAPLLYSQTVPDTPGSTDSVFT